MDRRAGKDGRAPVPGNAAPRATLAAIAAQFALA
jgi:hypothetical protein